MKELKICKTCQHLNSMPISIAQDGLAIEYFRCANKKSPRYSETCASRMLTGPKQVDSRNYQFCKEWEGK